MRRATWLRKRFEALVSQGLGAWMEQVEDSNLGDGIFIWSGKPTVQVFENGFTYDGKSFLKLRYEEMTEVDLLDLRSLMRAHKIPDQFVEFAVLTAEVRHVLHIPLFLYTTLSGVLNDILKERS
jgi:hypothetical protein